MQHNSFRRYLLIAAAASSLLLPFNHAVAEPKAAQIMPKADRSMLLDIQKYSDKMVAVGERGHVLISNDGGQTWQQKPVPTAKMLTAVHFVDANNGWAVGHDGHIVMSKDGGETWTLQRDGLAAQKLRNEQKLKNSRAELRRLQRLQDEGVEEVDGESIDELIDEAEWQKESAQEDLHAATVAPPLMDVWFANEKQGFAVGAFGVFLSTEDGGATWNDRTDEFAESVDGFHLNGLSGTRDGLVVLVGEAAYLAVSNDFGKTWQVIEQDHEGTYFAVESNADGSLIVATGLRGLTVRSQDKGQTWEELETNLGYSTSSVTLLDDTILLTGAGGTIAISLDRGDTFNQFTQRGRVSLSQGVFVDNNNLLLVGQGGTHRFEMTTASQE